MAPAQTLSQRVESYRFWDIVALWARERLEHDEVVARALARAVVLEGLRLQSIEARRVGADQQVEFRGQPYVGFCATPATPMSVLRIAALDHLLAIVHRGQVPSRAALHEEFSAQ